MDPFVTLLIQLREAALDAAATPTEDAHRLRALAQELDEMAREAKADREERYIDFIRRIGTMSRSVE